jgi:acyl-CoA reductase-like NAD-dependent aldehyde dehydrogenase
MTKGRARLRCVSPVDGRVCAERDLASESEVEEALALAWTGVKDSGRGCSLSPLGFESLTRPKSFHLREPV